MALLVCGRRALGNMVEEQKCNGGGGGGRGEGGSNNRSCKKQKQEKIPQRGLGVAELERILYDQQRSNNGAASAVTSGLVLPLSLLQGRQTPAATNEDFHSPHFRNIIPNLASHAPIPPLPPVKNHALHDRPMSVATGGYDGTSVLPPFALQNDPMANNPIWWYSPQQLRRTQPQHHQQQQSTVTTSMSFLPSSSGVHLQMEPPSSQINHSSSKLTIPPWKEAEKVSMVPIRHLIPSFFFTLFCLRPFLLDRVVLIKRPRPFAFEHTSNGDSCEIPTFSKLEDTRSPFGLDHIKFEQGTAVCRDDNHLPTSSSHQVDRRSSCNLLSLGPSTSTVFVDAKSKRPMPIHTPFQASVDEVIPPPLHPGRLPQALPFYEFLPAGPMRQEKCPGEQEEADDNVDLNLKL